MFFVYDHDPQMMLVARSFCTQAQQRLLHTFGVNIHTVHKGPIPDPRVSRSPKFHFTQQTLLESLLRDRPPPSHPRPRHRDTVLRGKAQVWF